MKKFILGLLAGVCLLGTVNVLATTPKREFRLVMLVTECPNCGEFSLEVEEAYVEKEITEQCHECGYYRHREMEPEYVFIYGDVVSEYIPKNVEPIKNK